MADEKGAGGEGFGIGVVLLFFAGVFALWLFSNGGQNGGFFGNASSTSFFGVNNASSSDSFGTSATSSDYIDTLTTPETHADTAQEIESQLHSTHQELGEIKEELRIAKVWGVHSPFEGKVRLGSGSTWGDDPTTEYLTITASGNEEPITISGWSLESTVSGARVAIPTGVRLVRNTAPNSGSAITLEPSGMAYVVSGTSPVGTSFHENKCVGYLSEFQNFTPSLYSSCPYPRDEMEASGKIALSDDSCYAAISHVSSCRLVSSSVSTANLSAACRTFLQNDLTYAGCVKNHQYDPYFYDGSWRIYLGKSSALWRSEREIIRLLDSEGKTVDILQF